MTDIALVSDALQSEIQVPPMEASICGTCVNSKKLQGYCNHDQQLTSTHARSVFVHELCIRTACWILSAQSQRPCQFACTSEDGVSMHPELFKICTLLTCTSCQLYLTGINYREVQAIAVLTGAPTIRVNGVTNQICVQRPYWKPWPDLWINILAPSTVVIRLVDWKAPPYCNWECEQGRDFIKSFCSWALWLATRNHQTVIMALYACR